MPWQLIEWPSPFHKTPDQNRTDCRRAFVVTVTVTGTGPYTLSFADAPTPSVPMR